MCGRFRLSRSKEIIAEHFDIEDQIEWSPRYNIAPAQRVAVYAGSHVSETLDYLICR
jgi:putative SOS response-associated peptidase YedK